MAMAKHGAILSYSFKKSSAMRHHNIVDEAKRYLSLSQRFIYLKEEKQLSLTPEFKTLVGKRPFIIADHGGYSSKALPELTHHYAEQFLGLTEHTVNGEARLNGLTNDIPYVSNARTETKIESDISIARNIVIEAMKSRIVKGLPYKKVVVVGFGVMGQHSTRALIDLFEGIDITVHDIDPNKLDKAHDLGFHVNTDIESAVSDADIIFLCTNSIKEKSTVLSLGQAKHIKSETLVVSMTSLDDEIEYHPNGYHFDTYANNNAGNVHLPDGGADNLICKVEAESLLSAFRLVEEGRDYKGLSQQDYQMINRHWNRHFAC